MASIANNQDPEQQANQSPNQTPAAGAPVSVSGTAGASASGGQGAGTSGPAAPTAPAAGVSPVQQNQGAQANSGYVDVGSYLDANQGGSQQLGTQVASNLTNDYNNVKSGIDSSAQNTQTLADQGYTHENSGLIQQAASNPISAAANPTNVNAVQAQLNDTYSGPTNWADLGTQSGNVATGQQEGQLATTPGGLNVLSQQVEGNNTSQGINQLDTLLLGGSPTAMNKVQAASDPFNTLTNYLNTANTNVTGAINVDQNNAAQAQSDAKSALLGPNGATTQLTNQINQEMTSAQQSAQQQNATIKAALQGMNPTPADLTTLGLSQQQWNTLKAEIQQAGTSQTVKSSNGQFGANTGTVNIDPTQYLTQQNPTTAITAQNVATPQQYTQAQALQSLVGANNWTTNLTDPTQAGTAPTNLNSFNATGANATATGAVTAEQAAAQAYVSAMQQGADAQHAQLAAQNAAKNSAGAALASTPVAASEAAVSGLTGAAKNIASQYSSGSNAGKSVLEDIASGGLATPAKAIEGGIQNAVHTITNIFCFHPDTLIEMADGNTWPIHTIQVGDKVKGGRVLATRRGVGTNFYMYNGVLVTAKHAVRELGKWVRIENAQLAVKCPPYTEVVCNLVTESHRIYASGVEFADEHETDRYESLDLDQSLAELNSRDAR